jgi:rare lipoprotein A
MNTWLSQNGWLKFSGTCMAAGLLLAPAVNAYQPFLNAAGSRKVEIGLASFYEDKDFGGQLMAWGEPFRESLMIAAHPTYPEGTIVRVTNLENGRSVQVRIADRGPAVKHQNQGVVIDLSRKAAEKLGFLKKGRTLVQTEVIAWGSQAMQVGTGSGLEPGIPGENPD